jgi:hypothetical protein
MFILGLRGGTEERRGDGGATREGRSEGRRQGQMRGERVGGRVVGENKRRGGGRKGRRGRLGT